MTRWGVISYSEVFSIQGGVTRSDDGYFWGNAEAGGR
jgi:hypothetical protein